MDKALQHLTKSLFWDTDINKLDLKKHKKYIIERILELGRTEDIKWLTTYYTSKDIQTIVKSSSNISPKTANYWALHLRLPLKDIKCLHKPLTLT